MSCVTSAKGTSATFQNVFWPENGSSANKQYYNYPPQWPSLLPCMPPTPAMHATRPCMPLLPRTPPCHVCPLPRMLPSHAYLPATHGPPLDRQTLVKTQPSQTSFAGGIKELLALQYFLTKSCTQTSIQEID